jgi:hypothetical protein
MYKGSGFQVTSNDGFCHEHVIISKCLSPVNVTSSDIPKYTLPDESSVAFSFASDQDRITWSTNPDKKQIQVKAGVFMLSWEYHH